LAQTDEFVIAAIERLFFQRCLARGEERLTPSRETGSRAPQLTRHQIERFPAQQTEDDLSLLPCGKPLSFLPPILAPLSSRSMSSLRGELYG
jgi:hypothetical protein